MIYNKNMRLRLIENYVISRCWRLFEEYKTLYLKVEEFDDGLKIISYIGYVMVDDMFDYRENIDTIKYEVERILEKDQSIRMMEEEKRVWIVIIPEAIKMYDNDRLRKMIEIDYTSNVAKYMRDNEVICIAISKELSGMAMDYYGNVVKLNKDTCGEIVTLAYHDMAGWW